MWAIYFWLWIGWALIAAMVFTVFYPPVIIVSGFLCGLWQERDHIKRIRRANRQEGKSEEWGWNQTILAYDLAEQRASRTPEEIERDRRAQQLHYEMQAALGQSRYFGLNSIQAQQAALGQARSPGIFGFGTIGLQAARNHQAGLGLGIFGGKGGAP